jgi:hypothetical protein
MSANQPFYFRFDFGLREAAFAFKRVVSGQWIVVSGQQTRWKCLFSLRLPVALACRG